jgi:16S rRNA (cytosine967-C5)-methyltransferase
VLIDAPCSGSGTFRRNPGLKLELTEEMVSRRVKTQREILDSCERFVKPGGRLIYATCSLLRMENEEVLDWFLRRYPDFHVLPAHEILGAHGIAIPPEGSFLRLLPHRHSTDGFFAAVLGKG